MKLPKNASLFLNFKRWHTDLRFQVLVIYVVLFLPLFLIALAFNAVLGERIRADVKANDLALTQAIAQKTEIFIFNEINAVYGLGQSPQRIIAKNAETQASFALVARSHPNINLIYYLDHNGIMQYHYPVGPNSTVGEDFSFRDYFQRALRVRSPFVSEGRISPTTGQPVATAVMPLRDEHDHFLGIVGSNIRLESLSQTLLTILMEYPAAQGLDIVILDSANQIVATPQIDLLLLSAESRLPKELPLNPNQQQIIAQSLPSLDSVERLYTQVPVASLGWRVVASRPTAIAFANQTFIRQITALTTTLVALIGLFFWFLLSRRILYPVEHLMNVTRLIAKRQQLTSETHKLLLQYTHRKDQIGNLMHSVLAMNAALEQRIKQQNILLETSKVVVSTLDLDTVLHNILEQMGRLLAIQMYAIVQRSPQNGEFRIRASRGLSPQYVQNLAILPNEPDSVIMRALNAGESIQVSDTETDPSYIIRRLRARAEGYRAILAIPLRTHYAPSTVLVVFYPVPHVFDENEIQLLVNFANYSAMSIENATLFERSDSHLREQTYRLESLVHSLHEGLILSDLKGNVIYINHHMMAQTGTRPITLQQAVETLLQRAVSPAITSHDLVSQLLNEHPPFSIEFSIRKDGLLFTYRLQTFDVKDAQKKQIGLGLLLHDITADKELDRMRSSLIATVSHELRTPLAAIKGYSSTLLAEDVQWQPDAQKKFLQIISNETDRLSNMINDILDLSRIESGALRLHLRECQLQPLLYEILEYLVIDQQRLQIDLPAKLPSLLADPLRLQSILRNLLENALKYGGEDVKIYIKVELQPDNYVQIRICDDGPGIPIAEQARIFEPFYRVPETALQSPGGAGLGLAICQGLVQAHSGKLWLDPQPRGVCFVFTIPAITREMDCIPQPKAK